MQGEYACRYESYQKTVTVWRCLKVGAAWPSATLGAFHNCPGCGERTKPGSTMHKPMESTAVSHLDPDGLSQKFKDKVVKDKDGNRGEVRWTSKKGRIGVAWACGHTMSYSAIEMEQFELV